MSFELFLKTIICGSGWIVFLWNRYNEKEKNKKEFKEKFYENIDKLVELSKNNPTDQDYYLIKDKLVFVMENYNLKTEIKLKLSDSIENFIYKLRNKEPYRDTQKGINLYKRDLKICC